MKMNNEHEWAIINERGIIVIRDNWDIVFKRWSEIEFKGLLVEILEEK